MSEITHIKAALIGADDARALLNWRDWTHEAIVYGLNMQQLLDLYHASSKYVSLEGWLDKDPSAEKVYAKITGRKLSECA